jgi:hypothetical protein
MNYKGTYSGSEDYSAGDVVVFTDGIAYDAVQDPPAGTTPHNLLYWHRLDQPYQEIVLMFHNFLGGNAEAIADIQKIVFDAKTIVLASSTEDSDKTYAITVDDGDSGGELSIDEIVEEAET